ncbi:cell division protein FtsQ/DivIB [Rhodococcus sp. NPDC058481]|uniref:cell division protein FtsQ/DivIB n=1 Tax=unclassified Rhodococcus (in: high G+C Gram-positive bacteria) TaxID=192944 RepID=UPI003646ED5D
MTTESAERSARPDRKGAKRAARKPRRGTRPRNRKRLLIIAMSVVALLGLGAAAWFTPLLSVRKVSVVGNVGVPGDEVLATLAIPAGKPLLQIDVDAAARRVAAIPKVDHARVERRYPSTVRVTVVERAPAVFYDAPEGTHLMDAGAVAYAIEPPPPGVPRLKVERPGREDPVTVDALTVLTSMPPPLRAQVGEIAAGSISDIRVTLLDGRQLVWGSVENTERKSAIALPLLGQPGKVYDISSPDLVTVK